MKTSVKAVATPENEVEQEIEVVTSTPEQKQPSKVRLRNRSKSPFYLILPEGTSIHLLPTEDVDVDESVLELPQVKVAVDDRDILIIKVN